MHVHIAIVGSGFAGLGAAIRLRDAGFHDLLVLERAGALGGTWRDNTYPGCACDVPSRLYSFSFAQNANWSRLFSPQAEILTYLHRVATHYALMPCIRFNAALLSAAWNSVAERWELETARGPMTASVLIMATGALSDPVMPELRDIAVFQGPVFHTAQWNHDVDLVGKRVAVIGTGASAIQVVPAIQPNVLSLLLLQRTAPWIVPRRDKPVSSAMQALYRFAPGLQQIVRGVVYATREMSLLAFRHRALTRIVERVSRQHLAAQVPNSDLRAALTPAYRIGCKRILVSDNFYPALTQPNVTVVTNGISHITPNGIVTQDGVTHEVDVIIAATGFQPTTPPLAPFVCGRDGRTLASVWTPSMRALASTSVSGFPNLFIIPGPNSGLGHTSMIYMIESQIAHVLSAMRYMQRARMASMEARADSQTAYADSVDRRMTGTVWTSGGCASWYLDASGRNSTLWPDFTFRFRRRVARMRPHEYHFTRTEKNM